MPAPASHKPIIAVCGAGHCGAAPAALAEEIGRRIAEAGAALVCGGLGGGTGALLAVGR